MPTPEDDLEADAVAQAALADQLAQHQQDGAGRPAEQQRQRLEAEEQVLQDALYQQDAEAVPLGERHRHGQQARVLDSQFRRIPLRASSPRLRITPCISCMMLALM